MRIREKHALWLRLLHWLNVPVLGLMVWSGLLIYWANNVYGPFFPEQFFITLGLRYQLAHGMAVHFSFAWLFVITGLFYLIGLLVSGHWREIAPPCFGIGRDDSPDAKFSRAQRIGYSAAILMAAFLVLSGFAIYKPVQLAGLAAVFGGYEGARLVHFCMTLGLCGFAAIHIIQVARAGWNTFRAMVAGFEVEDER